jgi:hypothetical protein
MSFGSNKGEPVEYLAIGGALPLEASQIVARTLNLIAMETLIDHREVDASRTVMHAHLGDEPRTALAGAEILDQDVADGLSIVEESEGELPGCMCASGPHGRASLAR